MVFTNNNISNVSLRMSKTEIERVHSTKFLGVIVDDKLNWKQHIGLLKGKLSKCIAVIYKASTILDSASLLTLYNSMFLPYISYCAEIWGNAFKSNLQCITIAQKRVVRIVAKVHKLEHTHSLFHKYSILKFTDLVRLKIALIVHKAKLRLLPPSIQHKFTLLDDNVSYKLRSLGKFKVQYARTTKKSSCISVSGVSIYNSLPMCVKLVSNTQLFKKRFKSMIFNNYMCNEN